MIIDPIVSRLDGVVLLSREKYCSCGSGSDRGSNLKNPGRGRH